MIKSVDHHPTVADLSLTIKVVDQPTDRHCYSLRLETSMAKIKTIDSIQI